MTKRRKSLVRGRITEARQRIFLETLAATGSWPTAARTASPNRQHPDGPSSSFRSLRNSDPDFAARVVEAEEAALGRLEAAAMQRSVDGIDRPIYQGGKLMGYEKVYSDTLLIRLLEARDPRYSSRSKLELSGQVNTIGLQLTPEDLLALSDEQQLQLEAILGVIVEARQEQPAAIEHHG